MQRLPIEIMTYIADSLGLHDIFNLSLACRQFRYLSANDDICRAALETHMPYSIELRTARSSKQYARCLRRLVKIREAITAATPYSAACVALVDDFIYCDGMLCYTDGYESLRLLDLHNSADLEIIIDTRALLQSIPKENLGNSKYKFRPVHFANGIISCVYNPPKTEGRSRLLIIDVQEKKLLAFHGLESTSKLFVRNNREYLYYGTHSVTGDDGFKRWVLKQFDIRNEQWIPGHLDLEDLVGSDVGSTVCFEIIDDCFYGLSSLASFEVYETDWTSYYYGFRLPVGSSRPGDMQLTTKDMWRRQHDEGPIDDRWSTLQLEKNPVTGGIMATECRREWLVDECSSTRTSYRTELKFSNRHINPDDNSDSEDDGNETEVSSTPTYYTATPVPTKNRREMSQHHRGDDGSTEPVITLSHCFIRSYNQSCGTFIDLVNDPIASESRIQRPQLRSISRFHQIEPAWGLAESLADGTRQGIQQHSTPNKISWWLPEIDAGQHNPHMEALDRVLNPKGQDTYGNVSGVMDNCSMVYAIGPRASQSKRPLVFISFDPAIKLSKLVHWPGGPMRPFHAHMKTHEDDARDDNPYPTPNSLPTSALGSRNSSFSEGSGRDPSQSSTTPQPASGTLEGPSWARNASAKYLESLRAVGESIGYNFAYCGAHLGSCRY